LWENRPGEATGGQGGEPARTTDARDEARVSGNTARVAKLRAEPGGAETLRVSAVNERNRG